MNVGLGSVLLVSLGAVVGVLVGAEVAARLPDEVLPRVLAVFLVLVAARMLVPRVRPAAPRGEPSVQSAPLDPKTGDPGLGTGR